MSNSPLSSDAIRADEVRRLLKMLREIEQAVLSAEGTAGRPTELAGYRLAVAAVEGWSRNADRHNLATAEVSSVRTA